MSEPKLETWKDPQSPGVSPPEPEEFRQSSERDISARVSSLEFALVRHDTLLENCATKTDIADLDKKLSKEISDLGVKLSKEISDLGVKLSKEIAGLAEKLTVKRSSSNRFLFTSFLGILTFLFAADVLVLNWLWDLHGNAPFAPVVPVYTPGETPYALPSQVAYGLTRAPDRQFPALAAETTPAPSAPESGPPETERTEG
ncbi:MAG: hypothetical protein LBT40_13225 [Deltaproteobacteria bacterium]|jgi:hypothetical protein|nr:hypothetical protein [Deltaproteobacteria bacterium]